jgi:pyrroline-5-carboxylate reductase
MKDVNITFIGGGNMARSLVGGLLDDGIPAERIWVADPNDSVLRSLNDHFAIHVTTDNNKAMLNARVLILAIKPQLAKAVVRELAPAIQNSRPLVISIAAGIRETDLRSWMSEDAAIVRTMPNTPALVRSGATALFANKAVSKEQRNLAESIMRAVGMTLWVDDESLMDAVTALSGSGPAYFFLIMEALENAGEHLGLPRKTARLLILQTAFGAAKMALESNEDLAELRQRVTSPGGTTERAISVLQQYKLEAVFDEALRAAHQRSVELAEIFGGNN